MPGVGLFAKMAANTPAALAKAASTAAKAAPSIPGAIVNLAANVSLTGSGRAAQNGSSELNFFDSNAGIGVGVVIALAFVVGVGCCCAKVYRDWHKDIINRGRSSAATGNWFRNRRG